MPRITIEQIQEELIPDNWKVISTEYKNLDSELIFECSEGHRVYNTWKKIRTKRDCPICAQNQLKDIENNIIPKKSNEFRVLALDQATKISGWAIFSNEKLIKYGTFETQLENEIQRDIQIKNWLINIIKNWGIDFVALEGVQYEERFGVTTFATLARLQGILMSLLEEMEVQYTICHTATWRNFCQVKGKTRADKKKSMQLKVKEWYDITVNNDCADAIGIGHYAVNKTKKPKIESWE
jgi:Holliday junction resolvasome RuvABC endonuclease subunit